MEQDTKENYSWNALPPRFYACDWQKIKNQVEIPRRYPLNFLVGDIQNIKNQVEIPRRYPLNFSVRGVQNIKIRLKILGVAL
jgi:hypothetical protein